MKSVLAILTSVMLLLESLFPSSLALAESSKLSNLYNHYLQHQTISHGTDSFATFLWMHYNPDSNHQDASHNHEKLPCLNVHHAFFGAITPTPLTFVYHISEQIFVLFKSVPAYSNAYRYLFSLDLLNPPQ